MRGRKFQRRGRSRASVGAGVRVRVGSRDRAVSCGRRAYDLRTARWLQRDPIDAASGDPNLYRYCGNDPVNYRDPTGTKIHQELTSVTSTRGRMEIVRMALEEARQTGSVRATQWWSFSAKRFLHHIFPQQLREKFSKIGINIDECVMDVPDWFHSWVHSGGKNGGMWNEAWRNFFDWVEQKLRRQGKSLNNLDSCTRDWVRELAKQYALDLLRWFGIPDFDWKECLRYKGKKGVLAKLLDLFF